MSGCQLQTSYEFLQLHHHLVRIPHSVSGLHMFGLLLDESQQCGSFSGIRQPALLDFVGAHRQTPALPLSLFCFASLLDGETHIWLESAFRLLSGCFCVLFCFLFAMLHEHRCQCRFYFKLLLHMQRPSLRSRSAIPEEKKDEQPQEAPPAALGLRLSTFFFSSMADVALWLGPYMSISSKMPICTRTKTVWKCRQITTNQTTHKTSQTTRKSPSQTCVSSRETTNQTNKRGRSPNKNTHQKDLPKDTVV